MKRSTWVLLCIIAALMAFILLFERKTPSTDEARQQKSRLFSAKIEDVKALSRSGFEPLSLKRKDEERWDLETPVADKADRFSVDGFTDRLKATEVTRWVEGATAKDLGLDPPRATWMMETKNGLEFLDVGAEAPLEAGLYVRANGRAALVPKSLEETLLRHVSDFRSKELVAAPERDVRRFSLVSGGRDILAFEHDGDAWRVTAPFKDAGDSGKLQNILDDACLCPVDTIIEDNPKDLAKYGLAPPERSIKLEMKSGAPVTVMFGGPVPDGDTQKALIYAHSTDRPAVFAISGNSIKSLSQDPEGLRSLALFSHDPYEAGKIEVRDGFAITLAKDAKGMWTVEKPAAGAKKAENGPALFTALAGLKGTKAAALGDPGSVGLGQPFLTLVLSGKGWEESALIGAEKDGTCYAKPAGRDVALALSKDDWQTALAALEVASGSGANASGPKK